jgi:hypothetical protein
MICPICFDSIESFVNDNNNDKDKDKDKGNNKCIVCPAPGQTQQQKQKQKIRSDFEKTLNSTITLDCKHTYHYGCIIDWFNTQIKKKSLESTIRKCPYCRKTTGHLKLLENMFPMKYIHKEYKNIEYCLIHDVEQDKMLQVCSPYFNKKYCSTILKTGTSKGQQCRKKKGKESIYCHIHKKKFSSIPGS